jgi:hypothetical protein
MGMCVLVQLPNQQGFGKVKHQFGLVEGWPSHRVQNVCVNAPIFVILKNVASLPMNSSGFKSLLHIHKFI